jgi:PTS system cellobiose-specific IIC component
MPDGVPPSVSKTFVALFPAFLVILVVWILRLLIENTSLLIIPFVLTPLVLVLTTYIGMSTGFAPKTAGIAVPWTTPPIIGGYLATGGNIRGALMQVINLAVAFAIYYPFFRMWDKQNYQVEQGANK